MLSGNLGSLLYGDVSVMINSRDSRPELTHHYLYVTQFEYVLTDCVKIRNKNNSTHDTYLREASFQLINK